MTSPLARFKRPKQAAKPFLRAEDANALDAESVAAALGLTVKQQGRHYELSNGMRGTLHEHLVWCHKDSTGIGDNCALAQAVTGLQFRPALELLLSGTVQPIKPVTQQRTTVLRLPDCTEADKAAGRAYLARRGVSAYALARAEAAGMLGYSAGAVLFIGRDADGKPRSATRRGYLPNDPRPKRDLAGTDKSWPAYIPGQQSELWVVEGGVDALAVLTQHCGEPHPSVIVTGGVNVTAWLTNPHIQSHLLVVQKCVVACEREKDPETQTRTDEQRQRLIARLQQHCPAVALWMPPTGFKDLGDTLSGAVTPESLNDTLEGN